MEEVRINKYLASAGVCSRRNAEEYILAGRVKINGEIVINLATKVKQEDVVELDGKQITLEENRVYIMLNKPKGYVTTSKEQFKRLSVLDLIDVNERIFAVGRLDMDSEGLLILTNDGDFANSIIHPTKHIKKTYEVSLRRDITIEDILKLEEGVDIGGYTTKPCKIQKITNKRIYITISEGKNRQIRRMVESINNKVDNLKRISIGNLELGNLKTGKYVFLDNSKIKKIFDV